MKLLLSLALVAWIALMILTATMYFGTLDTIPHGQVNDSINLETSAS